MRRGHLIIYTCASSSEVARKFGLSHGVMVTQRPLEALFMVRIHVGQPIDIPQSNQEIAHRAPNQEPLIALADQQMKPGHQKEVQPILAEGRTRATLPRQRTGQTACNPKPSA